MSAASVPGWADYRRSIGDRSSLFAALAQRWPIERALYPGSYLDLSPSTAIPDVTYADLDKRAARYFGTDGLVGSELAASSAARPGWEPRANFLHADYRSPMPVEDGSVDLLISLYAGLVWDHCSRYLAPGGLLLANTSHGDASVAALDPRLELVAAVHHRGDAYRLDERHLEDYLVPKRPASADVDLIRQRGRGIAYTRTAFAYVFRFTPGA